MSQNLPAKVHSRLSASSAHRWVHCAGSIRMSEGMPNYESVYAQLGTAAHAVAETALKWNTNAAEYVGATMEGVTITSELAEPVQDFIDYCRALMKKVGKGNFGIEERVFLDALNPPEEGMGGTADFWAYDAEQFELEVVDYKNGSGVVVQVPGNYQLRIYALGVLLMMDGRRIDRVKITVIQPNAPHEDGGIRSYTYDVLEMLEFAEELMVAARRTLDPDAPLVPGPHCKFCPASGVCPAQREHVQAIAQVTFEAMPLDVPPTPTDLPPEVFADIYDKLPILEEWARAMHVEAQRRLESGSPVPGRKLVARRATRQWRDPEQVEKWLREEKKLVDEEIFDQKLKSPAQIEKVIGKKNLPEDLTKKESKGYVVARDTDPRPAVAIDAAEVFRALPSGTTTQDEETE